MYVAVRANGKRRAQESIQSVEDGDSTDDGGITPVSETVSLA